MIDYILLEEFAKDKSVLFVEDDENILKETSELLGLIFPKVDTAKNGQEGFEKYLNYKKETNSYYDFVITDIQMPILDGIEFTKLVYKQNDEQVLIVLSAHSESHYLLELINLGISQFITKPLDYDKFVNTIYLKLKDIKAKDTDDGVEKNIVYIDKNLYWNKQTKQIFLNDENIKLTKKEIMLLELLLKYSEKTHTLEELLNYLWMDDDNSSPTISNLKNIVSRLRKKIPELDIENIYGFGYRLNIK
ncbi:MAG: response regulator transcription factor [Halarcobacter sp.]